MKTHSQNRETASRIEQREVIRMNPIPKKYKAAALILVLIPLIGVLTHSVILCAINQHLPFSSMAADPSPGLPKRFAWLQIKESVIALCGAAFFVGGIIFLYFFARKAYQAAFHKLLFFFSATVFCLFACTIPFGLADQSYFWNYLFPIWSILGNVVLFFVVWIGLNVRNHRRMNLLL